MFLMLVISRVSTVRITSARSRMASVVSLNDAEQSTMTRSCVPAEHLEDLLDAGRRDQLGHLRARAGRAGPGRPRSGSIMNVSSDLGLAAGLELGDEVGDRLVLGVEVEQDADVAELERAVDEGDLLAELGGRGDGQVDGDRGPADAALGAEDGDDLAGLAGPAPRPAAGDGGRRTRLGLLAARGRRPGGSTRSARRG